MKSFPRTLRDAAEALDVIAAPKARALKLISPTEAIATPPTTGRRVVYTCQRGGCHREKEKTGNHNNF